MTMSQRLSFSLLLVWAAAAVAGDAPHNTSVPLGVVSCNSCHKLHQSPGGTLNNQLGNYNLCESCHGTLGPAFGFPWVLEDQAVPGAQGHSHRWDADAGNPAYGAEYPLHPEFASRIENGKILCSACHDQHTGAQNGGTQHASYPIGAPQNPLAWDGGSSATLTLEQPSAEAAPMGYLVKVTQGGAVGSAQFQVSNDNGYSWFGWNGSAWLAGNAGSKSTAASGVTLNDPKAAANLKVGFGGTLAPGDQWRFYVSYPFLRIRNEHSEMCEDCHRSWTQSSANVRGLDGGNLPVIDFGNTVFSHPVGEGLANSYDRPSIRDANGQLQSVGDGIKTNDLKLDPTNKVRCMTCHYLHNADSNSLTEDPR